MPADWIYPREPERVCQPPVLWYPIDWGIASAGMTRPNMNELLSRPEVVCNGILPGFQGCAGLGCVENMRCGVSPKAGQAVFQVLVGQGSRCRNSRLC